MKLRLEKQGAQLVIHLLGRVVFITNPDQTETETGYFDDSAAQAGLEALRQRLIAEGWTEHHEPPQPPAPLAQPWVTRADADEVLARLLPVTSPAARALLEPLLRCGTLTLEGGDLECALGDDPDDTLRFTGPGSDERTPASLAAFLDVCGGLELGEVGDTGQLVLHDGFSGTLHTIGKELWPSEAPFSYSPELCSPIDLNLGAFYVFDPSTGRVCFGDEGPLLTSDTNDALEVYLREVHQRLKVYQPSTPLQRAVADIAHRHTWLT